MHFYAAEAKLGSELVQYIPLPKKMLRYGWSAMTELSKQGLDAADFSLAAALVCLSPPKYIQFDDMETEIIEQYRVNHKQKFFNLFWKLNNGFFYILLKFELI